MCSAWGATVEWEAAHSKPRSYIWAERTERRAMKPSQLSKFFSPLVRAWLWNWRKYLAPPRVEDGKHSGNFHLFHHGECPRIARECQEIRPRHWPYSPRLWARRWQSAGTTKERHKFQPTRSFTGFPLDVITFICVSNCQSYSIVFSQIYLPIKVKTDFFIIIVRDWSCFNCLVNYRLSWCFWNRSKVYIQCYMPLKVIFCFPLETEKL